MCVFLHAVDRCCRGGRHSPITRQHLRSVRLSYVAHKDSSLGYAVHVDVQHSTHDARTLRCCHLSRLVQQQRKNTYHFVTDFYGPISALCLEWNNCSYFTPDNGDRPLSQTRLHLGLRAVMFTKP